MFKFLNKKTTKNPNKSKEKLIMTASLLIHAAKIDQNYSEKEKEIIEKALTNLSEETHDFKQIMSVAEKQEADSNQILEFTREIKNTDSEFKIKVIESLWEIIYSNKQADIYETNLMRRLTGLLYLDNKTVGDIKKRMEKKFI